MLANITLTTLYSTIDLASYWFNVVPLHIESVFISGKYCQTSETIATARARC